MKTFNIRVTQALVGFYEGRIEIEAVSKKSALNKLKNMTTKEIDELADWTHGDEYNGDHNTIEIHEDSIY
jgi:hypothetical protein